jgi:hypothetical protein
MLRHEELSNPNSLGAGELVLIGLGPKINIFG